MLGPVLFSMYSSPVAVIARQHGVSVQLYADDTQAYMVFDIPDAADAVSTLENCVNDVNIWMKKKN